MTRPHNDRNRKQQMNRTEHKAAYLRNGGTEPEYNRINAAWESHNAAIRAARAEWEAAIGTDMEDAAGTKLDAAMKAAW